MYDAIYKRKEIKKKNKLTNVIYYYSNICYNYHSIDYLIILLIYSLTFMYTAYFSHLVCIQTATAIWSGKFLVLITFWGGNWSGIIKRTILFCFVLFCFGAIVVYITPMKLQKSYLQILSALLQNWIFLSGSCHHPTRSCVFYLL